MGAIDGRLLTYEEASSLVTIAKNSYSGKILNQKIYDMLKGVENDQGYEYYWLGTQKSTTYLYCFSGMYVSASDNNYDHWSYGVRPVLTVLKSNIQ